MGREAATDSSSAALQRPGCCGYVPHPAGPCYNVVRCVLYVAAQYGKPPLHYSTVKECAQLLLVQEALMAAKTREVRIRPPFARPPPIPP